MPKVSVIIPCYNLGEYINETIESVLNQTFQDFEIIIVNDGSTEKKTIQILNSLANPKLTVIHSENEGLPCARNNGIKIAGGKYILPLDADDKIAPEYLEKAVEILDENENIGVVYCQAKFFGEDDSEWDLAEYTLSRILIDNLIFCSALYRKEDWKLVGGYKPTMKFGWEDYEFWLSLIELDRKVYRIPEYLFFYRQRNDSMANLMSREKFFYSYKEIIKNHKNLYFDNIEFIFEHIYSLRDEIAEKQKQLDKKNIQIHDLNSEVIRLNSILTDQDTKHLNGKELIYLLNKKFMKKIFNKFRSFK